MWMSDYVKLHDFYFYRPYIFNKFTLIINLTKYNIV